MGFEEIALADLADNDYNPRRRLDEDRISELAQSIERVGLISPLTVRELDGDGDQGLTDIDDQIKATLTGDGPTYEVVAGTRRLHALREIHGETSDHEVPCQVVELPDDEAELVALAENLDRDDLTPTEEAEAFAERVFVTTDKATVEALGDVEVRRAGNNYTVPFASLVDHLNANGAPQGAPLPFPHRDATSVEAVAGDIASRTPVEIARRVRLYALPEEVWSLVDDEALPLRQAETIAGVAGEAAPWEERVDAMIELAERCVEEAWSKVECREETQGRRGKMGEKDETLLAPAKAGVGEGEETLEDLLCRVAEIVDDIEEPVGEPSASEVEEAREAVERRLSELDEEIGELEERAGRLDELSARLEVGMEARFRGTFDGFDSRKTYCSYCGQGVTKGEIREVIRSVEVALDIGEQELDGIVRRRDALQKVRLDLQDASQSQKRV